MELGPILNFMIWSPTVRFPGDVLLSPGIMLPRPITLSRAAVIHTRSRLQTVPRHGKCVQRWAGPLVLGAQPPVVSSQHSFPFPAFQIYVLLQEPHLRLQLPWLLVFSSLGLSKLGHVRKSRSGESAKALWKFHPPPTVLSSECGILEWELLP